jgi:hypothetical protein
LAEPASACQALELGGKLAGFHARRGELREIPLFSRVYVHAPQRHWHCDPTLRSRRYRNSRP